VDASRVLEINDPSLKFQYAVQKHMGFDDFWYKKHILEINDPSRNSSMQALSWENAVSPQGTRQTQPTRPSST